MKFRHKIYSTLRLSNGDIKAKFHNHVLVTDDEAVINLIKGHQDYLDGVIESDEPEEIKQEEVKQEEKEEEKKEVKPKKKPAKKKK